MKKDSLRKRRGQTENIRRMVVAAMLSAITAVMVFTPLGMIQLPPPLLAVTMAHLPVLLAALVESISVGVTVGVVFGMCSLIRAWQTGAVGLTLFFRNPLISVLPRILIPLVVYGIYLLWRKCVRQNALTSKVGAAVAGVAGALTNTVACLSMLLLLYGDELAVYSGNAASWLIVTVGLPNGIAEAVVAAVLTPVLAVAVEAVQKRTGRKKLQ